MDPERLLREHGLRVTAPRVAVLDFVARHPHADVETIAASTRTRLGRVSTQAIYDVLAALTRARLVRRIEPAGSPTRYETRTGDNHHHLVCRACGSVHDIDCLLGAPPCLTPDDTHGYAVDEAEVILWGLCPTCAPAESTDDRTSPTTTPPPITTCSTSEGVS